MNRRDFVTTGSVAALGFGLSACGGNPKPTTAPRARRAPLRLAPVRVSWERVIRTTVGLRPHRDSGFVLKPDRLDDKLLVHNYGHGGAGMSLAWGTGLMAAEFATEHQARKAAVIGCGSVGLTCARQLQRRGFDVTIYAAAIPPNVTSNMSLAGFTPSSGLVVNDQRTDAWDAQYQRAYDISYRQLQLLAGNPISGVSWLDNISLTDREPSTAAPAPAPGHPRAPLPDGADTEREIFGPGEHPFDTKYAIRSPQIRIEPNIYLDALMRDVVLFGGRIVVRKFDAPRDLMALAEPIVVNCTGLGARDLFGDQELVPLKGQLTVLVPQDEVTYHTNGGLHTPPAPGQLGIHMMSRRDGIILGGTSQRGVWTLEPDEAERKRVVESHMAVFGAMKT
ncbi:MAG TPA: FAD-dependent oxidoreductase [Vicinamibacterales bacterium]|nr:FAD-dependent oxidoreductase [Vicinamibacterales bacterium]